MAVPFYGSLWQGPHAGYAPPTSWGQGHIYHRYFLKTNPASVPLHAGRTRSHGVRSGTSPKSPPPGYSGGRLFRNIPRSAAFRIAKAILNLPVGLTRLLIGRYSRPHTARSASENGYAILWSALTGTALRAVWFLALFSWVSTRDICCYHFENTAS